MTLLGSPSLLHDHGDTAFQHLESMLTSYLNINKSPSPLSPPRKRPVDDSLSTPSSSPSPPPRHASLLFETTAQKMTRYRTSLEKQVLLKQLYTKLQTTKRHGMILLDRRRPFLFHTPPPLLSFPPPAMMPPSPSSPHHHHQNKPYLPTRFASKSSHHHQHQHRHRRPSNHEEDDDDVPLGTLLSQQQQVKQFHRSGISVT